MALHLAEKERTQVRAALKALGPERCARLAGKCFAFKHRGFKWSDRDGCCAMAVLSGDKTYPISAAAEATSVIAGSEAHDGLWQITYLNDDGALRTRAAVAELLAIAAD